MCPASEEPRLYLGPPALFGYFRIPPHRLGADDVGMRVTRPALLQCLKLLGSAIKDRVVGDQHVGAGGLDEPLKPDSRLDVAFDGLSRGGREQRRTTPRRCEM